MPGVAVPDYARQNGIPKELITTSFGEGELLLDDNYGNLDDVRGVGQVEFG